LDNGAKDHRRDHHLDQRDERIAQRLQRIPGLGKEVPDQHANGDGYQHLDI
jgi:hypothetical protein